MIAIKRAELLDQSIWVEGVLSVVGSKGQYSFRLYKDSESYLKDKQVTFIDLIDADKLINSNPDLNDITWALLDGKDAVVGGQMRSDLHGANDCTELGRLSGPYLIFIRSKNQEHAVIIETK
jgi:hypothetical protein